MAEPAHSFFAFLPHCRRIPALLLYSAHSPIHPLIEASGAAFFLAHF
jgi:hypothetical protein